ncbi:MAG TPA: LacI family DNA-binding transcriptional regulator [Actinophytocola sp.]|nr:LacI family DNA-binding transcriptional regulator [Actinophytocola sp.]
MAARKRRRTVTMSDVAATAGVSITTVSHVVNRTRTVAPEATQSVLDALESTGYLSHSGADREPVATRTIGLALPAVTDPYFGELVHVLNQNAAPADYSLLLAETLDDPAAEYRAVRALLRRRVDALILAPSPDPAGALELAEQRGVPIVLVDRFTSDPLDQVGTENQNATAALVTHLLSLGHRHVGLITGRPGTSTTIERHAGYRDALEQAGIEYRPQLVVAQRAANVEETQLVNALLGLSKPPTAVAVMNNRLTLGALRGLQAAGLRVPDDMAVVAFDDVAWADLLQPGLTVVAQPMEAIGRQVMDLALSRIDDSGVPPRQVRIRPAFVHRSSCGCHS